MAQQNTHSNPRFLRAAAITSLLWATTFVLSKSAWLGHPDTLPARLALVVVGVGGFIPVVFVYAKSIRMQDEFTQRVHLVAIGIAYATIAVVSYAADLITQAGFIPQIPALGLWALMVFVWFISMLLTSRYYR